MRISYHEDVDILTIVFEHKRVKVSAEVLPGVIVDFDHDDQITAFEIMDASKFTDLSKMEVFISQWGDSEMLLEPNGALSMKPLLAKSIPAGD